jgi:hypothetical protein
LGAAHAGCGAHSSGISTNDNEGVIRHG